MKTTITFRDVHGLGGDLVDAHDGHEVALLDDQPSNHYLADDGDRTYQVACRDCADGHAFPAWGDELELTTSSMPCTDFTYVGSDPEDGPYSKCGTHPHAPEVMGDPDTLDVIGWCEEWRAPSWSEVNLHREVLRRFRNAKNNPTTTKEN